MKLACFDGPDFDAHGVNFDELMLRQGRFAREEAEAMQRYRVEAARLVQLGQGGNDPARVPARRRTHPDDLPPLPVADPPPAERPKPKNIRTILPTRVAMPERDARERAATFDEVTLGYSLEQAVVEAERCLLCKKPRCVPGCPVEIAIPDFIAALARKDLRASYGILEDANALPAVCGRVCPQELQCEATCVVGNKLEPVAIGRLERFVADYAAGRGWDTGPEVEATGKRVAIVGSGPAGLACAGDLVKAGVDVTVFEALHVAGGVLVYGIPEFRLPNDIIDIEVDALRQRGVRFELDMLIGKVLTIPQLLGERGFGAVFVGTGAGSPKFMGIEGESLNGVVSANELLTRVNLMQGFRQPLYDTPVGMGTKVAVIGAGNTAMDAARVSLRMGAEAVYLVYRRSRGRHGLGPPAAPTLGHGAPSRRRQGRPCLLRCCGRQGERCARVRGTRARRLPALRSLRIRLCQDQMSWLRSHSRHRLQLQRARRVPELCRPAHGGSFVPPRGSRPSGGAVPTVGGVVPAPSAVPLGVRRSAAIEDDRVLHRRRRSLAAPRSEEALRATQRR
jgi:hypothetical protein